MSIQSSKLKAGLAILSMFIFSSPPSPTHVRLACVQRKTNTFAGSAVKYLLNYKFCHLATFLCIFVFIWLGEITSDLTTWPYGQDTQYQYQRNIGRMTAVSRHLSKKRKTQDCWDTHGNYDNTAFIDTALTRWPLLIENISQKIVNGIGKEAEAKNKEEPH